jgi:glycosyltransferase involved in cell wall biosynthesis
LNLGSLTQPQVAEQMMQTGVWLAPSFNTMADQKFYETYCIGAQEAAAGGACVIASDWGALTERLEQAVNSIAIPEFVEDEWVSAIVQGMTTPVHQKSNLALTTTWSMRADQIRALVQTTTR